MFSASPPVAFLMARSMLSLAMFWARAARMAARSRGLCAGSGRPCFAATVISRASLENSLERSLSCRPLRNMMFLYCEWPAMWNLFPCAQIAWAAADVQEWNKGSPPPEQFLNELNQQLICHGPQSSFTAPQLRRTVHSPAVALAKAGCGP